MGFLEGMHGNADNRTIPVVIGVTGHRAIRKEDEAPLRSAVKAELEKLMDKIKYLPAIDPVICIFSLHGFTDYVKNNKAVCKEDCILCSSCFC